MYDGIVTPNQYELETGRIFYAVDELNAALAEYQQNTINEVYVLQTIDLTKEEVVLLMEMFVIPSDNYGMAAGLYDPSQHDLAPIDHVMNPDENIDFSELYTLYSIRTPYVGNNSAVGRIIYSLPQIDTGLTQRYFSIGDTFTAGQTPNALTLYYEPIDTKMGDVSDIRIAPKISALLFVLIDNLEEINYAFRSTPSNGELYIASYSSIKTYSKKDITEYLGTIGLSLEDFHDDWNSSVDSMFIYEKGE